MTLIWTLADTCAPSPDPFPSLRLRLIPRVIHATQINDKDVDDDEEEGPPKSTTTTNQSVQQPNQQTTTQKNAEKCKERRVLRGDQDKK